MRTAAIKPKAKAYYPITWDSCFLIYDIEHEIDDVVLFALKTGDTIGRLRRARVRYTSRGEPYFSTGSAHCRIYLIDCMKMA